MPPGWLPRRGRSRRGSRSSWRAPVPTRRERFAPGWLPLHDRAHLDRASEAGGRDLRRQIDGGIQIVGLVDEVTVEGFLGFDEWSVGRDRLAILHPHGGGGLRRLQAVAG